MKKLFFTAFLAITAFMLQSCSVTSDITYHKDAASTVLMDMDFKELLTLAKAQGSADTEELEKIEKLPKEWTSFYDMEKNEGNELPTHPDSIRIMKKMFMKGNYIVNELSGMSIKFDHFTKADYHALTAMKEKEEKLPLEVDNFNDWDGKKLIIDTDKLSLKDMEKSMAQGESEDGEQPDPEQMKAMMSMMMKKFTINMKFENDIKIITGKHDWIKQTDKRTIQIEFDTTNLDESKKFTNKDRQIVVVTE